MRKPTRVLELSHSRVNSLLIDTHLNNIKKMKVRAGLHGAIAGATRMSRIYVQVPTELVIETAAEHTAKLTEKSLEHFEQWLPKLNQ